LSFANDGSVLAIASSYLYEHEDIPDNIPEDAIYIRFFKTILGFLSF